MEKYAFFEAQPFIMRERPDRAIVDFHTALDQLGAKTTQSKICLGALQLPVPVFTDHHALGSARDMTGQD